MSEISGPFNSGPGALFDEVMWRELFSGLFTSGIVKGARVNNAAGSDLAPSIPGGNLNVAIGSGMAIVCGFYYQNTAAMNKVLASGNATYPRIDRIVLRYDFTASPHTVLLTVLQGTPNASPVPVALTQNTTTFWDVPIAQVRVNANQTSLTSGSLVADERAYSGVIAPAAQGPGSGLNADLLDGIAASAFLLGSGSGQHVVMLNRTPTNADGNNGDIIFQYS